MDRTKRKLHKSDKLNHHPKRKRKNKHKQKRRQKVKFIQYELFLLNEQSILVEYIEY